MKNLKTIARTFIVFLLIFTMVIPFMAVNAASSIDDEKKKQQELEKELKDTNKFLAELNKNISSTSDYLKKLDNQMYKINANIKTLEKKATAKQVEIDETKKSLSDAEASSAQQYEDMKLRIKYLYETGDKQFAEILLSSRSISDFLNQTEYFNRITKYDREMLDKLRSTVENISTLKATLEGELTELEANLAETKEEQAAVQALVDDKAKKLDIYEGDVAKTKEEQEKLKLEIIEQEKLIKEMEEIERRRQEEALKNGQQLTYDGGQLMWPLPGNTRISSKFGYRSDPFTGAVTEYHNGLDIPAPKGTEIHAAYSGQIAWSNLNSSAGNWVGIDHGNGLYTVYMHMSKRLVSEGDYVVKGQVIGLVGSTGRSTGNHLHIGVRVNGKYVDPLTYITPTN